MQISTHGATRCQQRGIPQEILTFIINYGKTVNTHNDKKSFVTNKIFSRLSKDKEHSKLLSRFDKQIKSTAVIWNSETIVTAFRITKRNNWRN